MTGEREPRKYIIRTICAEARIIGTEQFYPAPKQPKATKDRTISARVKEILKRLTSCDIFSAGP